MTDAAAREHAPRFLLPERLAPAPERSGLDEPYWSGLADERLVVQRCLRCRSWQWGPEWICRECRSFDVGWEEVPSEDGDYRGHVLTWERVWHPTDRALVQAVPYLAVVVALPDAGDIRMLGNLMGDPRADVSVGAPVTAVFEHHDTYSLAQWRR